VSSRVRRSKTKGRELDRFGHSIPFEPGCEARDGEHASRRVGASECHPAFDTDWIVKSRRRDPDDPVLAIGNRHNDLCPYNGTVAVESVLPRAIADDNRAGAARRGVLRVRKSTERWSSAQDVEEVARDVRIEKRHSLRADREVLRGFLPMREPCDAAQRPTLPRNFIEVAQRGRELGALYAVRPQNGNAILIDHGQTANQNCLKRREHRGRGADTERKNRQDKDREGGGPAETADRDAQIL
jgi:hypothetical protein